MNSPKIELVSEGIKHELKINGVPMGAMVRKAILVVEANNVVSYQLIYGSEITQSAEIDVTKLSSEQKEYIARFGQCEGGCIR